MFAKQIEDGGELGAARAKCAINVFVEFANSMFMFISAIKSCVLSDIYLLLPEWSNFSCQYVVFIYKCPICMFDEAARANKSRTVVLSAMYVVVFARLKCTWGISVSARANQRAFLSTNFS